MLSVNLSLINNEDFYHQNRDFKQLLSFESDSKRFKK